MEVRITKAKAAYPTDQSSSPRGNNGNVRRSFGFGPVRIQGGIRLNDADWTHWSEPARTLLRIDKLGVTGSSPVPPTIKALQMSTSVLA